MSVLDVPSDGSEARALMLQHALLLLGNLASDAVDPQEAQHTKDELRQCGGFAKLLPHIDSPEYLTQVYALGTIQNCCMELAYVQLMQQQGTLGKLQALLRCGDANLEEYAKGCLANMRETIQLGLAKAEVEA